MLHLSNRSGLSHKLIGLMLAASLLVVVASHCVAADDQPTTAPTYRDYQPVWSPDGKKIAFVSTREALKDCSNIWVVNADGSGLHQLTFRGKNEFPTWSPDGTKLAFQSDGLIWQVELATKAFTPLTSSGRTWLAPDWHPKDVLKIVCSLRTMFVPQDNDLVVIDPTTATTRDSGTSDVRVRLGSDDKPRWSRDGSQIGFIGEIYNRETKSARWYLMTMRADSGALMTYCEVSKDSQRPSWLPDGTGIVFGNGKLFKFADQKATDLFPEPAKDADVSPDGKMVAYYEDVQNAGAFIFVRKMDGTGKIQITFPKPPEKTADADKKPADSGVSASTPDQKPVDSGFSGTLPKENK